MTGLNDGLLFTTDKCLACNKCIAQCSILGANVSVIQNGIARIKVDSKKCNHCGKCIPLCIHNARDYKDDTEEFLTGLAGGEKISLIVAPSFYILYPEKAEKILGYLKSLGVEKIYDASFGAEICAWAHVKYLRDTKDYPVSSRAFISNTCPALINAVEMYFPELLKKIIPVQSPLICTAIYAKKYLGDNNKFAFLGPCIAKKDEINAENTFGYVKYCCTFGHLVPRIMEKDISSYYAESNLKASSSGSLLPVNGEFKNIIASFFPENEFMMDFRGLEPSLYQFLKMSVPENGEPVQPFLADVLACKNGCLRGPGVEKTDVSESDIYRTFFNKYNKTHVSETNYTAEQKWEQLNEHFSNLNAEDFSRKFQSRYRQPFNVPESTYNEIFNAMLKDTDEKRNMNCTSCGYRSCREMATAIAYGYNKKENCIHYMNDMMKKSYYVDSETGLRNRVSFIQDSEKLIKGNPKLQYVICSGDINRFRVINDLYGFTKGTAVLKAVAEQLQNFMPKNSLIARLDGGNFAMCFEYDPDIVHMLYDFKFFDCSSLQIKMPVTMRFGLYITKDSSEEIINALNCATLSMDKSTSYTQNTYNLFTQDYKEQMVLEANLTSQMQNALDKNEFVMFYQPQYNAKTGTLVGAESLCRWIKSDGSIISPSVFIPLAEKNGFIRTLDKVIWRIVFSSIRKWLDMGLTLIPVSINISRVSLCSDSLVYVIKNLGNEFNIPPELIHFEITETAFITDPESVIERINKIRNLGYQIAMDDFGSGYSSLNTLKDIPIDILKLDMGFIRDGTNMEKGGSIISNVTRMAQSLEYITVAEGVETEEQAAFLRGIGTNVFQGYLYSKPISSDEFEKLLCNDENKSFITKPEVKGRVDVGKFYDPSTNESLLFEEFAGPAVIIEYDYVRDSIYIVRINQKCLKLFGLENYSAQDVSKRVSKFFKHDKEKRLNTVILEAIENDSEIVKVLQLKNAKTSYSVWVKSHAWEISNQNGKHIIYAQFDDVSEEYSKEEALELSNSQLELMMEKTKMDLCFMRLNVDLLNFKETVRLRVVKCNDQFCESCGYSKNEVENWTEKEIRNVIHPLDRTSFITSVAKYLLSYRKDSKEAFSFEYRGKRKGGDYIKLKMNVTAIKQMDGSYFLIVNIEHI